MKKLYTFLFAAAIATTASAQTYLSKDFDDQSATSSSVPTGSWSIKDVSNGDAITTWTTSNAGGAATYYGMIKNFYTTNHAVESWLISPATDLSTSSTPTLSFKSAVAYNGAALELFISTDYDGSSDPSSQGTWTPLTANMPLASGTWFEWTLSGSVDLSAYKTTGVYIAFKYTGTTNDGSTWEIDDILINETGAVLPTDRTVYEIQGTFGTADESFYKDQEVATGGIVSAVRADGRYYIQSGSGEYSGVYVYDNANTVAIGDSVTFYAIVSEYNGLTELTNISNFNKVSSSNPVPQTIITTAQAMTENYEGVLVTMQGATCTQSTDQNGEWIINDGSGDALIDDYIYAYTAATGGPYEVTGVVDYAFSAFKVQPRMASDIVTSVVIPSKTVYEIQGTLGTADSSYYYDSVVTTGGIVSAINPGTGYWIQSGNGEYSGVYVFDNANTVAEGDSVTFTCIVTEYYGLTELKNISGFTNVSSGNSIPQTIVNSGTASTEPYEGVLVTVQTANCTSGTNGFGEWDINDGSGVSTVGKLLYLYTAVTGGTYTVTGVVDYAFGSFIIQPRYAADILDYTGVKENNELATAIYPNPASSIVTIEAPANSSIAIYSIEGKKCFSTTTLSSKEMINVSSLESGNYIVSITNKENTVTQKLIVE